MNVELIEDPHRRVLISLRDSADGIEGGHRRQNTTPIRDSFSIFSDESHLAETRAPPEPFAPFFSASRPPPGESVASQAVRDGRERFHAARRDDHPEVIKNH